VTQRSLFWSHISTDTCKNDLEKCPICQVSPSDWSREFLCSQSMLNRMNSTQYVAGSFLSV